MVIWSVLTFWQNILVGRPNNHIFPDNGTLLECHHWKFTVGRIVWSGIIDNIALSKATEAWGTVLRSCHIINFWFTTFNLYKGCKLALFTSVTRIIQCMKVTWFQRLNPSGCSIFCSDAKSFKDVSYWTGGQLDSRSRETIKTPK